MTSVRKCPECGTELPPGVLPWLCPKCLLSQAANNASGEAPASPATGPAKPTPSDAPGEAFPQRFGGYELLERVGQGGMGIVYRARQISLDRIVAVKVLPHGALATKEQVLRFRTEAAAAGSLQHPNIVAIHEVGLCDDRHYLVMDFVEGQTLAQAISNFKFQISDCRRVARYVQTIAEAVHHAHEHGILHRDLKPSNVLIDADDQPRITDFGLAKRLESGTDLTVSGQVLGSPQYMPPEQAAGRHRQVGRRSDVYALGAILYHLLTGRPPFMGETLADILPQVANDEPLRPRQLNPAVPADLETVCLKCLEKETPRRYPTALALAEELGRFLEGKPVLARPVGRLTKGWRWCRRNPRLAAALGAALLSLLLGLAGVGWQWHRAEGLRARAETGEAQARQNAYDAEMNLAQQALAENNLGRTRELLDHHWPRPGQPDLRGWEWRYLWQQCQGDEQFTLVGHSNRVHAVAFSPDGRWLASAAADDTIRLWDVSARRQVALAHSPSTTYDTVIFSSDAQRLFTTAAHESAVRVWRVPSLKPASAWVLDGEASGLALSPDGQTLAAVGSRGVKLWNLADGRQIAVLAPSADLSAGQVAFSSDGGWLAANAFDGRIFVWDWTTGSLIAALAGHTRPYPMGYFVRALGFDGRTLVSAGSDSTVRLWDVTSARESKRLEAHASMVTGLALSRRRAIMATVSADQTVKLWDLRTLELLRTLRGHLNEVWAVAFSPDGATLATGAKDDTVKLWSTRLKPEPSVSRALPGGVRSFQLQADGSGILLVKTNGELSLVSVKRGRETEVQRLVLPVPENAFLAVAPGGGLFAASTIEGPVKTWILPACRSGGDFVDCSATSGRLVFSGDGAWMAATCDDRMMRVWAVATRHLVAQFTNNVGLITDILLSHTGVYLGIGSSKGLVEVWEVPTRRRLARLAAHKEGVSDMAFLLHPLQLVTASGDGTVKIWDLATQCLVATLRGSLLGMNSLAVSPDQCRLAAGSGEGMIKLWDLASREEVATFHGHHSGTQVAFSPDGNDLIAASQEAISIWHAPSLAEIDAAEKAKTQP